MKKKKLMICLIFALLSILIISSSSASLIFPDQEHVRDSSIWFRPHVTEPYVTGINETSATFTAYVGMGANCTAGFSWGLSWPVNDSNCIANVTVSGIYTFDSHDIGSYEGLDLFTYEVTNLTANTTYYIKSWVSNYDGYHASDFYSWEFGNFNITCYTAESGRWYTMPNQLHMRNVSLSQNFTVENFLQQGGGWDGKVPNIFAYNYTSEAYTSWSYAKYLVGLPQTLDYIYSIDDKPELIYGFIINASASPLNMSFVYDNDTSTFWEYVSFPQDLFLGNSSLAVNDSIENFFEQSGLWDYITWAFEYPSMKNWNKGAGGNTLHNITYNMEYTIKLNTSVIGNATLYFDYNIAFNDSTFNTITDVAPPILDNVNVTATNGFNVSSVGYINIDAYDDTSLAIIVNITVNGETFNESISNPGQTATYTFNLSISGANIVTIILTDNSGNNYTYQQTHYIYVINITLVNERTGAVFDWNNAKTIGGMISCNVTVPGKGYRLDLYTNENITFYYISEDIDILRFEFYYTNVTTVVIRSFSIDLLDYLANIGLVEEETEFYEQLIYSTGSKPVIVKNVYSDCFIETGYTSHAYGSTFTISALTIDMLYYLYTYDDGHTVFLASIEGSRTAQINLDFLDHVNITYTFSILSDGIGIARFDNDTIIIYYVNLDNDNSRLDIEIFDGTRLVFSHTEFTDPNEITVYFNYGAINLIEDILELRITAYDLEGNEVEASRFFSLATLSDSPLIPGGIAAIIAILLGIFGFTFVSTKHVFGFFGIFALVAGLGLTAFAEQVWYIRLVQVVLLILLAFVILIFKEESAAVT